MKFDIYSDIHLDTWLRIFTKMPLVDFFEPTEGVDTVVFAGDAGDGSYYYYLVVEILKKLYKNVIHIKGNHCLDSETECFTMNGWKKYDEINKDDIVLGYDIETDKSILQPIQHIHKRDYNGDVIEIKNGKVEIVCTPEHRLLISDSSKSGKTPHYKIADTLKKDILKFYNAARPKYDTEYDISDEMLKLIGLLITDGGFSKGDVVFYQSKPNVINEFKIICDKLNLSYNERIRDRDIKEICGKVLKNKPLVSYEFHFDKNSIKIIEAFVTSRSIFDWMYNLSLRQFDILLKYIIMGNGSYYKHKLNFIIYGMDDFLDELQRLSVYFGKGCVKVYDNRGDPRLNYRTNATAQFINSNTRSNNQNVSMKKSYNGVVWCLTTETSNFMIRRNGKTSFVGNCLYNTGETIVVDDNYINFLENNENFDQDHEISNFVVDGIKFSCCTLWTNFRNNFNNMVIAEQSISDFYDIPGMTGRVMNNKYIQCEKFLEDNSDADVFVTHFGPFIKSEHPDYADYSHLNPYFINDMSDWFSKLENKPKLWIHGHTHKSMDYIEQGTRVVANPIGYYGENQKLPKLKPMIVEI